MSKFDGLVKARKSESVKLQNDVITKRPGRPRAKRSNPDYRQITALIRKDTREEVQKLLIGRTQDFSELLQELLSGWVKAQSKKD